MREQKSRMSLGDVAKRPGIARDTVYQGIDRKVLPAHKIGQLWKFNSAGVDEWARSGGANSAKSDVVL